jgi:UDP-glucose 6-dehydrogenase
MEFDVLPELDDDNVYLEVEMLFYEFDANNNILQKNEENIITKIEYRIDKMTSGIKEYVCGNFQGSHYSVLNMTLHTVLTEYRFRHINKAISELTESEIYKMIFDPKAAAEYESKETLQSFLANNLGKEVS